MSLMARICFCIVVSTASLCSAQQIAVKNQIIVIKDEAKLYLDDEVQSKVRRGDIFEVLEVQGNRVKINTSTPKWIDRDDVATAASLRLETQKAIGAEDYLSAIESISNVLRLEKDRTWFDYVTRANIIPKIVLKEKDATIDKLPVAINAMTLVIEDWKEASKLGAPARKYLSDYILANTERGNVRRQLATLHVKPFTVADLCQVVRGTQATGKRDFAKAAGLYSEAAEDYEAIIKLLDENSLYMGASNVRDRYKILTMLYRQAGDCYLVSGELEKADSHYQRSIESSKSDKGITGHMDNAALAAFGLGLIAQKTNDAAAEKKWFARSDDFSKNGSPGLLEELTHWKNPKAKPLPDPALRNDGTRQTLTEQIISVLAEVKGINEERIKPDTVLDELGFKGFEVMRAVSIIGKREGVLIGLDEMKRHTGYDAFDDLPIRGTPNTMTKMFEIAKDEKPEYGR
ncbi:hypothetical protein [Stieleria varia]|uniref:Uncharacterized protein n=1 Tax=Stieleria varia TaxID=2528005 RepID=A0A5C6ATK3_9BACT|nr:hypothetical protein [Stieleria varia]TWU02342.1 hypothetical protein Pla52n_33920 [Stieleria varia]